MSSNPAMSVVLQQAIIFADGLSSPPSLVSVQGCLGDGSFSSDSRSFQVFNSVANGLDALREGVRRGEPFSVVVIEGWDESPEKLVGRLKEFWEVDHSLRLILCVPTEYQWKFSGLCQWHPARFLILRKPVLAEDLSLLLVCLGAPMSAGMPSGPGSDMEGNGLRTPGIQSKKGGEKDAELEQARDELATSKSFVDNILRSMVDSLFVITMDMSIGAVNPSLLSLLGYEEADLLGEPPGRIFGDEFAQGAIMEALMMQGAVSGVESRFLAKDGREIPISVSGALIQDERGQFQGMVCVAQDITDRKRMEEEKHQLHEQLLETSRQLGMAEVASDVLHNVGNVLNSVNVSVGLLKDLAQQTLVGDVGRISGLLDEHLDDLGTFLFQHPKGKQIPGYLRRLSEQLLDENSRMRKELGQLKESVNHAQQCVAAQQDLARAANLAEPFWLAELVEEAFVINEECLQKIGIQVIRQYDELPEVVFDRHQVLQVLVALIRNACQAMESTPLKQLTVRIKQVIGPPDSIRIEVEDSGSGIPRENLTRIFGQGYSTKQGVGRGMSLHSGALIVKNMGGELRALSEGNGTGATFVLDLPGHFHFPDL